MLVMNKKLVFLPATVLAQKIKTKTISILELTTVFLQHIKQYNPTINALSDCRSVEDILEEAKAKDQQLASGAAVGALFGVPITIKESFWVKGLIATNGDPLLRKHRATQDAAVVQKLKAAGAIILGMTNVPLFCIDWQTTNFWNGQTNNPYKLSSVAGGSSGGAAAAVAAGFSPISIGSDAGGSIRVPAHFCGIAGIRPTEGLLSHRGHLQHPKFPLGRRHVVVPGPLAKNVDDLLLSMEVLADQKEPSFVENPPPSFGHSSWDQKSLKIAVSEQINQVDIDQEYLDIFRAFINKISAAQHQIQQEHPIYDEAKNYLIYNQLISFEIGSNAPRFPLAPAFLYAFILLKYRDHLWAKGMATALRMSNRQYAQLIDQKDAFAEIYDNFLTKYDIWITPVCALAAFPHQKAGKPFLINQQKVAYTKAIASYTFTTAFAGHPIVVIPIGKKKNGLPVGIQIHAKKWSDKRLLEIAKYLEQFATGFVPPAMDF